MKTEKIVVVGRELNKVQKWLFEKTSFEVEEYLAQIWGYSLLIAIVSLIYALWNTMWLVALLIFITETLFTILYAALTENYIIRHIRDTSAIKNIDNSALKNSWIITRDMYTKIIVGTAYKDENIAYKIASNSHGHKIIDEVRERLSKYYTSFAQYSEKMTKQDLNRVFKHYYKTGEAIKINKEILNLKRRRTTTLREAYALCNGITGKDPFTKKALENMKRKELIRFLKEKFEKVEDV